MYEECSRSDELEAYLHSGERAQGGLEVSHRVLEVPVEEVVYSCEGSELVGDFEVASQVRGGVAGCGQSRNGEIPVSVDP